MDRFDAMRVFTRIVERRSFTRAADDLGLPRSSVTDAVKGREARLGVRLLQRSTRHVSPTLDGEAYYRRCANLISDFEDAEAGFTGAKPSGLVRIDVHGTQARHFLLPGLPRFLDAYPDIHLHIGEAHQALDMVREGFDCMLRAGELTVDSALIRRRLATLERGTFASPAYISRFGMPESVDALEADGHRMVGFYAPDAPEVAPFNFLIHGKSRRLSLPSFVTVTASGGLAVAPTSVQAVPFVVRFKIDDQEVAQRLPAGSTGLAAIYTDQVKASHVIRQVVLRQTAILNYVNPF